MTTFSEIPDVNHSPAAFTEIDDSQAGASGSELPSVVLVGYEAAGGSADPDVLTAVVTPSQADSLHGARSQLAAMCRAFLARNRNVLLQTIALDDAGTAATGQFEVVGTATEDGVLELIVAGERISVEVASGDAAAAVATAARTALGAATHAPVTAGGSAGDVDVTAAWAGPSGDDIVIGVGTVPAGLTINVTAMAGGATAPNLAAAIAALGPTTRHRAIVLGPSDAASLTAMEAEIARRWDATVALDGHAFAGYRDDLAGSLTFGATRNAAEMSIMPSLDSPTPPWIWAADMAAAHLANADLAAPRFGASMPSCQPPETDTDHAARNQLLSVGLCTHRVVGGRVIVDRLVTTYQEDAFGAPSTTWKALAIRETVSFLRRDWTARVQAKYLDHKLAHDGTQFDPGAKVVTPSVIRAEALAWYREKERAGLVESGDAFKERLVALRDSADANRINALIAPDIVNECVTIATLLQFTV